MTPDGLNELPSNRVLVLDNVTCPYCGIVLDDDNNTKEHVIGRRFVLKGTLNGCWNLIVRACERCNSEKSHLEDDISAITLSGKLWFDSSDEGENIAKEAHRKAKNSISNRTRKPAGQSQEEIGFEVPFALDATFKFSVLPGNRERALPDDSSVDADRCRSRGGVAGRRRSDGLRHECVRTVV